MSNFAALKKSSGSLDRLSKEIEKLNSPTTEKSGDDRFWQPEVDKSGNGMAIIRFLPVSEADGDEGLPWIRVFNHGFKGPGGKWYIENSLTTLNQKDPVSEYNTYLWNASTDDNSPQRKQARTQKRRLTYISNIFIVSDSKNPENEGKVFLYRYGKKIFDKISEAMHPPFDDEGRSADHPKYNPTNAFNPFDLWNGANLKLRIRQVDGYRNYDMSVFDAPSPLSGDDSKLEAIWKKQYSLKEFLDPKNFKSYDELKSKLNSVLELDDVPVKSVKPKPDVFESAAKRQSVSSQDFEMDDDDEDLKAFKALADD
jgi:hypothetical protein